MNRLRRRWQSEIKRVKWKGSITWLTQVERALLEMDKEIERLEKELCHYSLKT